MPKDRENHKGPDDLTKSANDTENPGFEPVDIEFFAAGHLLGNREPIIVDLDNVSPNELERAKAAFHNENSKRIRQLKDGQFEVVPIGAHGQDEGSALPEEETRPGVVDPPLELERASTDKEVPEMPFGEDGTVDTGNEGTAPAEAESIEGDLTYNTIRSKIVNYATEFERDYFIFAQAMAEQDYFGTSLVRSNNGKDDVVTFIAKCLFSDEDPRIKARFFTNEIDDIGKVGDYVHTRDGRGGALNDFVILSLCAELDKLEKIRRKRVEQFVLERIEYQLRKILRDLMTKFTTPDENLTPDKLKCKKGLIERIQVAEDLKDFLLKAIKEQKTLFLFFLFISLHENTEAKIADIVTGLINSNVKNVFDGVFQTIDQQRVRNRRRTLMGIPRPAPIGEVGKSDDTQTESANPFLDQKGEIMTPRGGAISTALDDTAAPEKVIIEEQTTEAPPPIGPPAEKLVPEDGIILPALELPAIKKNPSGRNIAAIIGIVASAVGVTIAGYILIKKPKGNDIQPMSAQKADMNRKNSLKRPLISTLDTSTAPVQIPDAGVKPDAIVSADAMPIPQIVDSGTPSLTEEEQLPLTKGNLVIIAGTQKGRKRLRKLALDENGVTVISVHNFPLYNSFRLYFIYQPEDIPEGKNLYINDRKLKSRDGKWYYETGEMVYFLHKNILEVK